MSDDAELERVEQMLRRTPAPEFVPATAAAGARRAALGEPAHVTRAPRRWRMPAWWRVAAPAAALGAAVAVAAVLLVGGRGGGFSPQFTLSMSGPQGATADVGFGHAANGVRPMVVHIHGLRPAGAGRYYEMWFRTGANENVSAVTFDTTASGGATFTAVIPAKMRWRDCWVTREAMRGDSKPAKVLVT
jgi:hypothetical protein